MAWKSKKAYLRRRGEEEEQERKEREKEKALREANIEYTLEIVERQKNFSTLKDIHNENLLRRQEREKEIEKARKEREEKQKKKDSWKKKFQQRTKKGQIPLDHRVNYMFKKIEEAARKR